MPAYALSTHLRTLFDKYKIDTVLDVGANAGQYRDLLRHEVGFNGQIISFEPIADLAALLRSRSENDPSWHINAYALGSENTTKNINIMADSKFSSFLEPDNKLTPKYRSKNIVSRQMSVNIHRLDDIFSNLREAYSIRNAYLKLDTQGYDLEVLKGGRNTLREIIAVQSEISFRPVYEGMPDFLTSFSEFGQNGFSVSGIFPVGLDSSLKLIEADCVMVKCC
ncbi:FkbM family methyltransferase [Methylocaldum sp.]|uniref:FkbM family methyltransferase n=1 Tax=Methylocaldum sp. TaxID=1969727 RepID=UPI002D76D63C|nr:FkbM family methyltransferase [Methylocaldum sp.]